VEPFSGQILLDGLDIATLGLQRLRSSLSIIPQDPGSCTHTHSLVHTLAKQGR
jgi:ABC-type multidrug transport system fused ATPase/permease subunit